jgi:hypothetical protein
MATTITNGPPPTPATVNNSYTFAFTWTVTSGGAPSFSVSSGALPAGLSLSSAGVISGVASGPPATYSGVITAGNGVGADAAQAFAIAIVHGVTSPNVIDLETPAHLSSNALLRETPNQAPSWRHPIPQPFNAAGVIDPRPTHGQIWPRGRR